jgi:aerobic carbon-monoxide dehydrogenase medium subunit
MMSTFAYLRPKSLSEAYRIAAAESEARFLAGGQTLIQSMKLGLLAPSHIIDLSSLPETYGISTSDHHLTIGAMTTHRDIAASASVLDAIPSLAALAGGIGDAQIRSMGTLGGSVANADPAACYPAALLALDAEIITERRSIAAKAFFHSMFETDLSEDEIILRIRFCRPKAGAYVKFSHPASRFAIVGVFVALIERSLRIAVTGARSCAFLVAEADRVAGMVARQEDIPPLDYSGYLADSTASPEYREALVREGIRRGLERSGIAALLNTEN